MIKTLARSPKQLGQAVRRQRRELKLSQAALAAKVGSYQKTISKLEAGDPGVKLQTLFQVLTALGLEFIVQPRSKADARIEDIF